MCPPVLQIVGERLERHARPAKTGSPLSTPGLQTMTFDSAMDKILTPMKQAIFVAMLWVTNDKRFSQIPFAYPSFFR